MLTQGYRHGEDLGPSQLQAPFTRIEMQMVNDMLMDQIETGDSSPEVSQTWLSQYFLMGEKTGVQPSTPNLYVIHDYPTALVP